MFPPPPRCLNNGETDMSVLHARAGRDLSNREVRE